MTASLYQWAWSGPAGARLRPRAIVDAMASSSGAFDVEDVGLGTLRVERDVVARPRPSVPAVGEEVVHHIALVPAEPEGVEVEADRAGLGRPPIDIDRDDNGVPRGGA